MTNSVDRWREVFQGVIALIIVVGAISVTVLLIVQGRNLDNIPAWLTLLLGAVAGTYFGQTGVQAGMSKATNGMLDAAHKIVEARQAVADEPGAR